MLFLLIAAALICSTAAANAPCSSLYVSYDLSPNFKETIAHSIHSMTVQGLRLFNPLATEDNRVPTVNHDIHDEVTSCSYTLLLSFSVMCYWLCFSRPWSKTKRTTVIKYGLLSLVFAFNRHGVWRPPGHTSTQVLKRPPPPPPTPIDSATEMLDGGGRLENRVKTSDWYRCLFYCTEHRSSPLLASAAKRISRMETAIETNFQLKFLTPTSQSLWKRHVFILSLENITCKFSVQRWKVRNGWAISKWW